MAKRASSASFTAPLERFAGKGGLHYVAVPNEVALLFTKTQPVRMICMLNEVVEFHGAIRPKKGWFYINIGTPLRAKAKIKPGDIVSLSLRPDKSEYGRKMPAELQELLAQDEQAYKLFHALIPSKQRGIIYYVDAAKSIDKRIERALMFVNRLKNDPKSFH